MMIMMAVRNKPTQSCLPNSNIEGDHHTQGLSGLWGQNCHSFPSQKPHLTYTFLEGALQSPDHQVFCPNALFLNKLGITGADTTATEVHGGLSGHHALSYGLQLPAQAGVQGVGSQDGCSWTAVPIKQCPVMTGQELSRKELVSGSIWLPQLIPGPAWGTRATTSA